MSERLSPQREAEIRDRIPAVYDGPWDYEWDDSEGARYSGWVISYPTDNPLAGLVAEVPDYGEQIAEFIAHARTDVPALLAEVERQRAELATVRAERDEAELMRDFTDFHLRQLSDERGEAESANEAWELGKITAEEALRRTDAAIQGHKTVTLDEFRAEREARS